MRNVIAGFGQFKLSDMTNSQKIKYKAFLRGKTDQLVTPSGKTWQGDVRSLDEQVSSHMKKNN